METMTTYRGTPVASVEHNSKDDTYLLSAGDGSLIAELKRHEFLSQPQLRSMKLNGRYRGARPKNNRGAGGVAGGAGGIDPSTLITWYPVTPAPRRAGKRTGAVYVGVDWGTAPKPSLKREGIVAGEIVGYRCWRVEGGFLRSVYQKDVWLPGNVIEGRGLEDWDERGIHAWKSASSKEYHDYIRGYLNQEDDPFTAMYVRYFSGGRETINRRPAMVTGTVFLWGDVVEHERGWRAEFARVRSLDWLYPDASMMGREQAELNELRHRYRVFR